MDEAVRLEGNLTVGTYQTGYAGYNALYVRQGYSNKLIYLSLFGPSKFIMKAISAGLSQGGFFSISVNGGEFGKDSKRDRYFVSRLETYNETYADRKDMVYHDFQKLNMCVLASRDIGKKYLVTTREREEMDLYNFFKSNYPIGILPEWVPAIREELLNSGLNRGEAGCCYWQYKPIAEGATTVVIDGEAVPVDKVEVFDFSCIREQTFKKVIESLGNEGKITLPGGPSKKLDIANLNSFMSVFGKKAIEKVRETIKVRVPEEEAGIVREVANKTKRLTREQARQVNGAVAVKEAGERYVLLAQGMGCGKTLQATDVIEACENRKVMCLHGDKTLKEMYENGHEAKYRAIAMMPTHLMDKWQREWEAEVPGGRAYIIRDFSDLVKLRAKGPKRTGRELYVISKDFARADSFKSPVPTSVKRLTPKAMVCKDCYDNDDGRLVYKPNDIHAACPKCQGRNWMKIELTARKFRGLTCPECGELLIKYSPKYMDADDLSAFILQPSDFGQRRDSNNRCYLCGSHLWAADVHNIGEGKKFYNPRFNRWSEVKNKKRGWKKVTHFLNKQHKSKKTAFVLDGFKDEYFAVTGAERPGCTEERPTEGPRRTSPAQYIKKHMKNFFDYCILDECHKFEGAGTAQAVAAQALIKASKFTIGCTGTLTNGKADSLFYLLWMLEPRRMQEKGYTYGDVMQFSKDYGCVETTYEAYGNPDDEYKACSRGKMITQPRVKPGMSPLLQLDFLTGNAVLMDLADLSEYLPDLNEYVEVVEMPGDVRAAYARTMDTLKARIREKGGRSYLSSYLQFGLSYPSKPWGVPAIMSVSSKDEVIVRPTNFTEYESPDKLLPKEEKLVETVNKELSEGRNMFIYCSYTGDSSKDCTDRLKALIERYCNLEGKVLIMRASDSEAKAAEREEYIHKQAAAGYRVIICNQRLVETGLDFCFDYKGSYYNFPTIIVYQITYELAVQMQSVRRHYRLNQTKECRTYYLVTDGTSELAALSLMADKTVAAAQLQGQFSSEGLAAMARGQDPTREIVKMLDSGNITGKEEIEGKFDVLRKLTAKKDVASLFDRAAEQPIYSELVGRVSVDELEEDILELAVDVKAAEPKAPVKKQAVTKKAVKKQPESKQLSLFDMDLGEDAFMMPAVINSSASETVVSVKKPRREKPQIKGQMSLFDMYAA